MDCGRGVLRGNQPFGGSPASTQRRFVRVWPPRSTSTISARTTYLAPRRVRRLDRFSQFSVIASLQAIADAGLTHRQDVLEHSGCYLGSALGGVAFAEAQHYEFMQHGVQRVNPSLALAVFGGAGPTNVAIELGLHGPSMANSNSCASGAIAIGEAFRLVRDGRAPLMLAGGVEAPLAPLTFGSFALIKAMSTADGDPCRR